MSISLKTETFIYNIFTGERSDGESTPCSISFRPFTILWDIFSNLGLLFL